MRHYPSWIAAMVVALTFVSVGAATEKSAPFPRRNPVTEAVIKTRTAIVSVAVPRASGKDSIGTGVIIDERGYIVTNCHVVGNASKVKVKLFDGKTVIGDVLMAESRWDLAIVRIEASETLQAMTLAPTGDLMVGEEVIAIGHPYGYANSVSKGIISALGREIEMPTGDVLTGLIQTDASINPGNSGGPLLNVNGEMIGINVALRDGAQGIAFAINADMVKQVLSSQLSSVRVSGVDHGLSTREEVTAETGEREKVLVEGSKDTSAVTAGDQIVAVGDHGVRNSFDLERALWGCRPGEQVALRVIRGGHEMTVNLTLRSGDGTVPAMIQTRVAPSGTASGRLVSSQP